MRQGTELAHELHTVELRQLVVGEDHVDPVVAAELQRAAGRVEQFQVEPAVDLPDDLREQQSAAEEVVDDDDRIALGSGESQFGDHAGPGRAALGDTHDDNLSVLNPRLAGAAINMPYTGFCCSPRAAGDCGSALVGPR